MTAFSAPPSASPSVTVISCCTITEYLHMLCGWCLRASVEHFQPKEDGLLKISSASLLLYLFSVSQQECTRHSHTLLLLWYLFLSASRNVLLMLKLLCHYYCIYFLSASRNALTTLTLCCYYCIYFLSASRNALTMLTSLCCYYLFSVSQQQCIAATSQLTWECIARDTHYIHTAGTNCSHLWHLYVFMLIHSSKHCNKPALPNTVTTLYLITINEQFYSAIKYPCLGGLAVLYNDITNLALQTL